MIFDRISGLHSIGEFQKVGNPCRLTPLSTLVAEKGFRPTFR
jgi:hypothetical protein